MKLRHLVARCAVMLVVVAATSWAHVAEQSAAGDVARIDVRSTPPSFALTPQAIREAIHAGAMGRSEPYALRHIGSPDNPVVVGVVYTPFVRVALLSRLAAEAGALLRQEDIDPHWLEPVVYVAFRWYCCDNEWKRDDTGGIPPFVVPENIRVGLLPDHEQGFQPHREVHPIWSRKGSELLTAFGPLPYEDIAVVAAFPLEAIRANQRFVIYREAKPGTTHVRVAMIRPDEPARWR